MEQRETAGITTRLIVDFVRREQGERGVEELLVLAGQEGRLAELENPGKWASFETRNRLFDAAAQVTGSNDIGFEVGSSALKSDAALFLRSLFGRLGSPRILVKLLPTTHGKFDLACETRVVELGATSAVIEFRTKPGYEKRRHDCRYAAGLLTQIGPIFSDPPLVVVERQCQVEGHECCVMELNWRRHRILGAHRNDPFESALPATALVQVRLDDLHETLADLVGARDIATIVRGVRDHAGSAVAAQRLVVAVDSGSELVVAADGIEEEPAREMALQLLAGLPPPRIAREHMLLADIAPGGKRRGVIVALSSTEFLEGEAPLLESYARLAAAVLDSLLSYQLAEARQRTAELLGAFARRLVRENDTSGIAQAAADATRAIVMADRALVMRHDEETGSVVMAAHSGYPEEMHAVLDGIVVGAEDTTKLIDFYEQPERPMLFDRSVDDPWLQQMFDFFQIDEIALVPIWNERRIFAMLLAARTVDSEAPPIAPSELFGRLASIGDQAASAWEKALLLEQVHQQASLDPLTGLANRRVFTEQLSTLLGRRKGPPLAVLFCDLDRFKRVNDALGHAAGDELLVALGRRLSHCVRSDDLVARLGGDEFTILLTDVTEGWSPEQFAMKVREEMAEPIALQGEGGARVVVRLSIGAVVASPGEATVRDVLRQADAAMYVAKARGGDRLLVFEETMLEERSERLELEATLSEASRAPAEHLVVLYQPQVDLQTGRVIGAEALVRWNHPRRGLLTPDRFLGVAEETGHIEWIDLHVLRTALAQAALWLGEGLALRIAVNFSARTLSAPHVVESVRQALADSGMDGKSLEIELTESTAFADTNALCEVLLALAELGVSVAIDDVGTGYSSLALLHRLPAQRLKIDRSFVSRVTDHSASHSVVEAVLLLARRLGQQVVAEGIETKAQASELKQLGCELGQGYLFARPEEAEVVAQLARTLGITPVEVGAGTAER